MNAPPSLLFFAAPAIAGGASILVRSKASLSSILFSASLIHFATCAFAFARRDLFTPNDWIGLDAPGMLFLGITSVLFLSASFQNLFAKAHPGSATEADAREPGEMEFAESDSIFYASMLFFLACMSLLSLSRNLGLVWIALEGTTLASAPMICRYGKASSLEATWKYLLICSVGISLALLGNFFLEVASGGLHAASSKSPLSLEHLISIAPQMKLPWLKCAFILLFVGYGAKMGLAPMHNWLPDAHSEAPAPVSALLSGALLNCAFLAILRVYQIMAAAGQSLFAQKLFVFFGLLSMAVASIFILSQKNYKRLLAYSSIENMGIIAFAFGLGGLGVFASIFHALCHSLVKGALFLCAGTSYELTGTLNCSEIKGLLKRFPFLAFLWILGLMAISGFPPSGNFFSEIMTLSAAFSAKSYFCASLYLLFIAIIFIGMARVFSPILQGDPDANAAIPQRERKILGLAPLLLISAVFLLGIHLPSPIRNFLAEVVNTFGGGQ